MSPRGIPQHSVHGLRGRLKAWLIAFNFNRFRAPLGPVIFFAEELPIWCDTPYNASRVFRIIWIAPECHHTTHLLFCRAATVWPRDGRKSCLYSRSKLCESLIYHPMSPQDIPQHSVNGSSGCLKAWFITLHFDGFRALRSPVIFFAEKPSYRVQHEL